MFSILAELPKLAVVKELLVHYREEDDSGSSSTKKDAGLMRMADMSMEAMKILQKQNLLHTIKEEFFFQVFNTHIENIKKILPQYQQEYFNKVHNIFYYLKNDSEFTYKYFHRKQVAKVNLLINGGNVKKLYPRWRFSIKKGKLFIRIGGIDICGK